MENKKKVHHEFKITTEELKAMMIAAGALIPEGAQCHMYQTGEQGVVMFVAIEEVVG